MEEKCLLSLLPCRKIGTVVYVNEKRHMCVRLARWMSRCQRPSAISADLDRTERPALLSIYKPCTLMVERFVYSVLCWFRPKLAAALRGPEQSTVQRTFRVLSVERNEKCSIQLPRLRHPHSLNLQSMYRIHKETISIALDVDLRSFTTLLVTTFYKPIKVDQT